MAATSQRCASQEQPETSCCPTGERESGQHARPIHEAVAIWPTTAMVFAFLWTVFLASADDSR
ncbi:MAG TPA: hypothetical protein PK867_13835 [Pirellulales bacterium]|nr:hypothetical protein [Pirellulales bacterium]